MIELKPGVRIRDKAQAMGLIREVANDVLSPFGPAVMTSANDSEHMQGSKHYKDAAYDFRAHHILDSLVEQLRDEMKRRLGQDFDVLIESRGTPNAHFHLEYDPKD